MTDELALSQPHARSELKAYLSELCANDPRPTWIAEQQRGLVSGIDQIFHFFFDDNDFDKSAVGRSLRNSKEVQLVGAVKRALEAIVVAVGDANDDTFVSHPLWPKVRQTATIALSQLVASTNVR